jgi:hypothetical protein
MFSRRARPERGRTVEGENVTIILSLGRRSGFVTLIGGAVYWAGRGELRAELYDLSIEWRPTGYECLWQPPSSNNEHNQRDD